MVKTQLLFRVDFYNLAAIEVLEALGTLAPSEQQINRIENVLKRVLRRARQKNIVKTIL